MVVERRAGTRKVVDQEVMVYHEQSHRLCKIHDLSMQGAMLDLGWGALTREVSVEMAISLPSAKGRSSYRLPAQVSRVTTAGTAIKFGELNSFAREAMQRYLGARQR